MELPTWPMIGVHGRNNLKYRGWTVVTEELGHCPDHYGGAEYGDICDKGRIVIVRLNNGYGATGTIPLPANYHDFATRAGNFVASSYGARIWVIGNEPNHSQERPAGVPILPAEYGLCYNLCRDAIHAVPGHEDDLVLLAPIAPWNAETTYPGNDRGDWLRYFRDVQLAAKDVDGFALHVYAREQSREGVRQRTLMQPPWDSHHWGFGILNDWMVSILPQYQDRPCFVTECNAYGPWADEITGFMTEALCGVWSWNDLHPNRGQLRCICFYRWAFDRWAFKDKPELQLDFAAAEACGFSCPDVIDDPDPPPPEKWTLHVRIDATSTHGRVQAWEGELVEVTS